MDSSPQKKIWGLTATAFDSLLTQLDSDRETAGQKYERIRQKLIKFFTWRGCVSPEDYTDRTIDRVARRIDEGAELRVADPYLYFHGVALNVLKEHWRDPERELESFDKLPQWRAPANDPHDEKERRTEHAEKEHRLECLDECVRQLPQRQLELITKYHQAGGLNKTRRREIAQSLGIPMNALRIRAYRIRIELERCVDNCVTVDP